MQAQATLGLWDVLFWIFAGSGMLGLPPGDRDPALVRAVPPQTLAFFEWAARGPGREGVAGIDGFAADPEMRQFFAQLDAALAKRVSRPDELDDDRLHELRVALPQLAKVITAHPGCVFVGFEPPPPNQPGAIAGLLSALRGVHGGIILSSGADTEAEWQLINRTLAANPDYKFDEASTTQTIPLGVPGYTLILHREAERIVFALGEGTLPRITEGLTGRSPGLDANPRFRQAIDRVAVARVSTLGWIDGQGTITSAMAALGPVGFVVRPMLTIIGIDAVDHVVQISGVEGDEIVQRTFVATGGRTDGVMVVAAGKSLLVEDFRHVPADADFVMASSLSINRLFDESRQLLAKTQPLSVKVFDEAVKELESELELKIVDDVLPAFGDALIAFDSPSAGGIIASSLVVSLDVRDVQKARHVFERAMTFVEQSLLSDHVDTAFFEPPSLLRQDFLGQTIYYVHSPDGSFPGHVAFAPCFALTERHLLFAVHPQAMKAYLRGARTNRAAFNPQQVRAGKPVPGDVLSFVWLDGARLSAIFNAVLPYVGPMLLGKLHEEGVSVDAFSIPSAAAIQPYFKDLSATVTRQKDGLFVEARNAPPTIVALAILSIYKSMTTSNYELMDIVKRQRANAEGDPLLGPAPGDVKQAIATVPAPAPPENPSAYRKIAPILLRALIPDDVKPLIPESTFKRLEEGPSPATIQRREEAKKRRDDRLERRKRRFQPTP